MPLFVAEHRHPADGCPAANPRMAPFLLKVLANEEASKHGLRIEADAVEKGKHHLYIIVDGPSEAAVRQYLAPFAEVGSLEVVPASTCEDVVARGIC